MLCFHDVRDRRWFAGLLGELSRRTTLVSLAQLVDLHVNATPAPPSAALTFDDGYMSVRTIVEPVCSELGLPFTAFVCGEVVAGGPPPWVDRVEALLRRVGASRALGYWPALTPHRGKRLVLALKALPMEAVLAGLARAEAEGVIDASAARGRFLMAEDLRALARNPLATVGSHSFSHPILANLGNEALRRELQRGIDAVQRASGAPMQFFAYPNGKPGDFDDATVQALREAGMKAAVTTVQRPLKRSDDTMRLPRLGVTEGDPVWKLELKWSLPWVSVGDARERIVRRSHAGAHGLSARTSLRGPPW